MVNWTILSAAEASAEKENKKMTAKNIDNVRFIIHLVLILYLYNNSKTYQYAIIIVTTHVVRLKLFLTVFSLQPSVYPPE